MSRPRALSAEGRRRIWLLPLVGAYMAAVVSVVGASWAAEHAKLARGVSSDIDGLFLGRALVWPVSHFIPYPPGRPYAADELDAAAAWLLLGTGAQAGVVGGLLWRFGAERQKG